MKILAIDPGNTKSAYVIYEDKVLLEHDICTNKVLLQRIQSLRTLGKHEPEEMAIEMIASYGMAVGKTVFETCLWIGRFIQAWSPAPATKVYRMDCKVHLCHSARAKDGNIRQALIDRYPATGGGKVPQVGIKSKPGPLFGVSKDVWAALAVAVTFDEKYAELVARESFD